MYCSTSGFNRTFMELKFGIEDAIEVIKLGFNRTFMELKSEINQH